MSTNDRLADPLISPIASILRAPLLELYALLWRAGVVEIVEKDPAARGHRGHRARRASERQPAAAAAGSAAAPDRRHG
ncbi:Rv1535 domain-containing protein [Mycobacterium sp.]|uniref:Rv1535 domain-containing protein n=1 Tax=Mycobacterium sp. TaxID=1785 RepID=UPI002BA5C378|nr:Rv1535 domain-containing protein [Mycobacterium sp.]HTQ16870.1 Rv1535 domain-containing protein [Mycobacterium sp.]